MYHKINKPEKSLHVCILNPMIDKAEFAEVEEANHLSTGQPFLLSHTIKSVLYDLVYSEFTFDGEEYTGQENRPIDCLTGYTLEEATTARDTINTLNFLAVNFIKHPDREEYALPYNYYILNKMPLEIRNGFTATIASKAADSLILTQAEMTAQGWF